MAATTRLAQFGVMTGKYATFQPKAEAGGGGAPAELPHSLPFFATVGALKTM